MGLSDSELKELAEIEQLVGREIALDKNAYRQNIMALREPGNWNEPQNWGTDQNPKPYPVDALPETMRGAVLNVTERTGSQVEVAAIHGFAVLSAATSGRIILDVKGDGDYFEQPAIFGLTFTDSGLRKTPVKKKVEDPLVAAWKQWSDDHELEIYQSTATLRAAEAKLKKAECTFNVSDQTADDLKELTKAKKAVIEAKNRLLVAPNPRVGDVTVEYLAKHMGSQNGFGFITETEQSFMKNVAGKYSGTFDAALVNKSWSGGEDEKAGRVGEGRRDVDTPFLAMGIHVQTELVRDVVEPEFIETGFLGRCLIARPLPVPDVALKDQASKDSAAMGRWAATVKSIVDATWGVPVDERIVLAFTPEGYAKFEEVYDRYREMRNDSNYAPAVKYWLNKAHGQVARLALLIALDERGETKIREVAVNADHVASAAALVEFHEHEIFRLLDEVIEAGAVEVRMERVLKWVARKVNLTDDKGGPDRLHFTRKMAHEALKGGGVTVRVEDIEVVLEELERYGWIREVPTKVDRKNMHEYCAHPSVPEAFGRKRGRK